MQPVFSVIIPVYNVAPYLRECLDSVLAQTFGDWEAICVDDGSTDESGAILDEYAAKDKRIKVIHQHNAGVSAARNLGLEHANGEYVGFVDADDKLLPMWFQEAESHISESSPDILRMNLSYWSEDGSVKDDALESNFLKLHERDKIVMWAWDNLLPRGWSVVAFFRRKIISSVRFNEELKIREDMIFILKLMTRAHSLVQLPYSGYYYRMYNQSSFHRRRKIRDFVIFAKSFLAVWQEAKEIAPLLKENKYKKLISAEIVSNFFEWMALGDRREWMNDHEMAETLNEISCAGLLDVSNMVGRWKLPLFIFKKTNRLEAFYIVKIISDVLSIGKKWLIK